MRSEGFLAGAVAGLAIALLVVGAASFLPQTSNPLITASLGASHSVTTSVATKAPASSTTTNGSPQFIGGLSGAQVAGIAAPASSSSSSTTPPAGANAASTSSAPSNQVQSGSTAPSGAPGQQKPSSLLAVLPGESVGSLIATVSPLLIALLVAGLVYGAYTRRQDSSS
jgi:hypothetical protein